MTKRTLEGARVGAFGQIVGDDSRSSSVMLTLCAARK